MSILYIVNAICTAAPVAEAASSPDILKMVLIALGVGLLAGFIHAISLKSALTSVHKNDSAADYERENSFVVERQSDNYVYSNTKRTELPQSNNK